MSRRGRKTAVMTVRLSKELEDVLLEDAERNGITESSLVNRIVKKYVEWDRHAEKFKFVSIPAESFQALIELIDEDTIKKTIESTTTFTEYIEATMLFWFKKKNFDSVLETINLLDRYGGLFEHEIEHREGSHVITLKHRLGKKWSLYVGELINQFIKKELNVAPEIICTDETAVIIFRLVSSGSRGSVD